MPNALYYVENTKEMKVKQLNNTNEWKAQLESKL